MGQTWPLFYLCPFSQYNEKYSTKCDYQSLDGVLGIRTRDRRMIGVDESTEVWRLQYWPICFCHISVKISNL